MKVEGDGGTEVQPNSTHNIQDEDSRPSAGKDLSNLGESFSPTTRGSWLQEEGEVVGSLESPFFPGTDAMRKELLSSGGPSRKAGVRPFARAPVLEESAFDNLHDSTATNDCKPDTTIFDLICCSTDVDGNKLSVEQEACLGQTEWRDEEQESQLAAIELQVLIEALLGGLCDPDSGVRWTAVDLLRVVLKREDERGNTEIGTQVLGVAVPLARLSDDGDTRVAAINAIYHAGKSCRGWQAHAQVTNLPEELHHHHHGEHHQEDHHYLHEHARREDDHNIEGWTLRDVLEDRLDDRDWMARRAATLAYSMLADHGDLDALHNVLPLLSDEVHGVRCAAMRAIETIAGSPFLMPNQQPTELQIQIVKAIIDRVVEVPTPEDDPWLHPELDDTTSNQGMMRSSTLAEFEEGKRQFQTELGIRMGLLFALGCMDLSGWQSIEHQKWTHIETWVHDQWRQVCTRKEADKQKLAEQERALNNPIMQAALAEMDATPAEDDGKANQQASALLAAALQKAAQRAATRMQARWRGMKGREVARHERQSLFIRMTSAEMERRQEEKRQRELSYAARLWEYMELRGLGHASPPKTLQSSSPGSRAMHAKEVILPYPTAFSVKSSVGKKKGDSKPGTPEKPLVVDSLLTAQSPSFKLHQNVSVREVQVEQENKKEPEDGNLPNESGRCRSGTLPSLAGLTGPSVAQPAQFWDPLARKRASSPPKKAGLTAEEEMAAATKLFFEWEEKERKRKEEVSQSTHAYQVTPVACMFYCVSSMQCARTVLRCVSDKLNPSFWSALC